MLEFAPIAIDPLPLLRLLQLSTATLPVGAYSYSEGLETLVEQRQLTTAATVQAWLTAELQYGGIRLEAAIAHRAYQAAQAGDQSTLGYWQQWWTAARETEEMRQQSLQMGQSLVQLVRQLDPALTPYWADQTTAWHYPIAFGVVAAQWQIPAPVAIAAYLHSWASNLVNAGVRLVPLGQTAGQQILHALHADIAIVTPQILTLTDADLSWSGWGATIASMQHETLYSRLFRS